MLIYPIQDWAEFVEQMMIAMFQKQEQSPKRVPIYSIGMQAIQISLTMKNANSFGAEPWVRAKTAGLGPRTFGVFFQHSKWNQRRLDKANNRQKWNRFNKGSTFLFQNVKFQRISAEQVTVKPEGSIVAGQKDNCADVAARSQFGDYPSEDSACKHCQGHGQRAGHCRRHRDHLRGETS